MIKLTFQFSVKELQPTYLKLKPLFSLLGHGKIHILSILTVHNIVSARTQGCYISVKPRQLSVYCKRRRKKKELINVTFCWNSWSAFLICVCRKNIIQNAVDESSELHALCAGLHCFLKWCIAKCCPQDDQLFKGLALYGEDEDTSVCVLVPLMGDCGWQRCCNHEN